MTLHLTLVRHGATDWNGAGRWQGWTDTPLGAHGEEQARRLAARLASWSYDRVVSSDLIRAVRTAELSVPGAPITTDARLRELRFGKYEGAGTNDVLHDPEYHDWQRDPWNLPAPGGGESMAEVGARLHTWAQELPDGRVIAFSHGAAIRALLCVLFGWPTLPVPGYVLPFPYVLAHTSLTRLERRDGRWTLVTYNDHAHLED
ncbi:broad specificity phosphatase PhoE [Deinococcus metalli]|uniref:Broad specificity phosphatase PhoE n=1 Tax=Deinococcus metalli TaxID=1141878 RepID=A0A7W8KF14_9DEIO|nr:histidine phosphatase family protein [Deinococcus metalli]MBB5376725.1 broad specificity phosphatase PhoE [Deinococcus metalli]GHF44871.1 phosphoglycerate mutase [Deinococcus metalli]